MKASLGPLPKIPPPPDLNANRQRRLKILDECNRDPAFRAAIYEKCKRDFKFWAETFCWAYDDFSPDRRVIPLVLWQFQWEMAQVIIDNIWRCIKDPTGYWNGGADKARRMTATFTSLLIILWFALFHGVASVVTSKTLEDVDIPGNMNTPFERLKWLVEILMKTAPWMFPVNFNMKDQEHYKKRLINFQNGGQISGISPKGKAMRQARALIWLGDEFAFVEDDYEVWEGSSGTVKVRLIFSTPNGPFCKFYKLVHNKEQEQFHCFELDWWKHPINAQGLYRKADGTLSSPAFDEICKKDSRQVIAREWLRDHNDSIGGKIYGDLFRVESIVENLQPDPFMQVVYCVLDPGLTFAAQFIQKDRHGRLLVLDEIVLTPEDGPQADTLLDRMAHRILQLATNKYRKWTIVYLGDPYGKRKLLASQKETEYEILYRTHKIRVISAYLDKIANREKARIEEVSGLLTNDIELENGTTTPALLVAAHCKLTIHAFRTGYRRIVEDGEVTEEVRESHPDNDLMDCTGMAALKVSKLRGNNDGSPLRIKKQRTQWRATQRQINRYGVSRYA